MALSRQYMRMHMGSLPLGAHVRCCVRRRPATHPYSTSSESSLPRIASPSLWSSMVPKPLRGATKKSLAARAKGFVTGEWNPATFFIIMSLLIGSNAIQLVNLKTRRLNYTRSTEAKLSLLREVIGRVQKGEDIDVEAMLGTGDPEAEKEWAQVMKELERDTDVWEDKSKSADKNITGKSAEAQLRVEGETNIPAEVDRKPGFY